MNENNTLNDSSVRQEADVGDAAEEVREGLVKSFLHADEAIASRIAARQAAKKYLEAGEKTAVKASYGGAKTAVRKGTGSATKVAAKRAGKKAAKKAAEETAKRTITETAKKASKAAVAETVKDASVLVASSSSTAAGAAAGTAAGTAGGPYGMLIGLAAGTAAGKGVEAGIGTIDNHFRRKRTRKQAMKDAFLQDRDPGMGKNFGKRFFTELLAAGRNLKNGLLFPGFFTAAAGVMAAVTVSLFFFFVILFVAVSQIAVQAERETIGRLSGGQEVVYYCQYEEPWASYPYGDSDISVCGCGPTTMAIVISTLKGEEYTPIDAADFATENNFYFHGVGTMWSFFTRGAESNGLTSVNYGDDLLAALECIPEGGMVVISVGQSDGTGNDLYRGNGHFMVIRGITEDGRILVADPASRANTETEWDYQTVMEILKNCWSITYPASE